MTQEYGPKPFVQHFEEIFKVEAATLARGTYDDVQLVLRPMLEKLGPLKDQLFISSKGEPNDWVVKPEIEEAIARTVRGVLEKRGLSSGLIDRTVGFYIKFLPREYNEKFPIQSAE